MKVRISLLVMFLLVVACSSSKHLMSNQLTCGSNGNKQTLEVIIGKTSVSIKNKDVNIDQFNDVNTRVTFTKLEPGDYAVLDESGNKSRKISIFCGARLSFFEQSSLIYYFDDNKFMKVWESD